MIKILKHCRSVIGAQAVSFHLECLLHVVPDALFKGAPSDYIPAVLEFIASRSAADWYGGRVMTPCGERDIFVAGEWAATEWFTFHDLIGRWSRIARLACDHWDDMKALEYWQLLLSSEYFPTSPA